MTEPKLKRFRCYHGTHKKPCLIEFQAVEWAILGHALEHVREAHPRFAKSTPDLEARLQDEIQDDVVYYPVGSGPVQFACQDLCLWSVWRCEFVVRGATMSVCVKAALEHFAAAHPRLAPDEGVLLATVRSTGSPKVVWEWPDMPLDERWRRR